MVGQTISHYRILEKLGEGGMGVVYKARDTHLDRFVAIKVLRPDKIADAERRARFVQEAKAASALNHPNIVVIHDISSEDGTDFIAMECVAGRTLDLLIGRRALALNDVLKYSIQIADALARAHAVGIVHRDLKPSNVMVDEHGLVKVLDFGLAKLTETVSTSEDAPTQTLSVTTEEGKIVGTAAYMSPEQAEGKKVDARSDIFSFGAMLYEMMTARRAFQGDSRMSTLSAVLREEPKPIENVPHDLEKVITRCLRKDPERRFQHMDDVKVALEELKEESDSGKAAEAVSGGRPIRRWGLWAGAVLALGLLAGGAWYLRTTAKNATPPLVPTPLTSYVGWEDSPSFSPDGRQVAFAWNGEKKDNQDIYVKRIGSMTPLRRTTNPASDGSPAFSPDGRWIGFIRWDGRRSSFVVVDALSGPERVVAEDLPLTAPSYFDGIRPFDWLPGGNWVVTEGIYLLSVESGEIRSLTAPAGSSPQDYTDFQPAVSPDGTTIAFLRSSGLVGSDIWLLSLTADLKPKGQPRRLTHLNLAITGLAWTPDGKEILFSAGAYKPSYQTMWRVSVSRSGNPTELRLGDDARMPAIARSGNRLAFTRLMFDVNIYRLALDDAKTTPVGPVPVAASTRFDGDTQYSPDGTRIAFASDRLGDRGIWVSDSDGSNPVELFVKAGASAGTPRWSPDGSKVAFDLLAGGTLHIYAIPSRGGKPVRLTSDPAAEYVPSWSRNGKWIYFTSNRSGRNEIWKVLSIGGDGVQVTRNGGCAAFESGDGGSLYYTKEGLWSTPLWRRRLGSADEQQLLPSVFFWSFFVTGEEVYFIPRPNNMQFSIQVLNIATGKLSTVATIAGNPGNGLSVAPNGRSILFTRADSASSDLMLVENFR